MLKTFKRMVEAEVRLDVGPGYVPVWWDSRREEWLDNRDGNEKEGGWLSPEPDGSGYTNGYRRSTDPTHAWAYVPRDVEVKEAIGALNTLAKRSNG